jgi:hypothetical protein
MEKQRTADWRLAIADFSIGDFRLPIELSIVD